MPTRTGTYGVGPIGTPGAINGVAGNAIAEYGGNPGFTAQANYILTAGVLAPGILIAQKTPPGSVTPVATDQWGWRGVPTSVGTFTGTIHWTGSPSSLFPATSYDWVIGLKSLGGGTFCPLIGIATNLPFMPQGVAVSITLATDSGTAPFTWDVAFGTLPTGLSLSSGGVLSGTPSVAGTFTFTLRATDAATCPGVRSYTVTVASCPAITVTPASPLPGGTTGVAYSQTLSASGGTAPYTWSITSGALPTGLSLSSGGALTGTPTVPAVSTFTALATDINGCPGSLAYSLTVACPAITVSPASPLPGATAGVAYSQTLTASGSAATPYVWGVATGALPTGLTLSSAGVLSGTPSSTGVFAFTAQAADTNGCVGTQAYSLTVVCPTIAVSSLQPIQTGFTGIPYNRTFVATGGATPYTWSVVSGALPTGLTLASNGSLSGTPTTLGTFSFEVRAVDANGCPSSASATPPISVTAYTVVIQGVQHMPGYPVLGGKFIAFTNGAPLFQPLANGKVETYQNRTSTPYPTYTDGTLLIENSNPVILDPAGRASIFIPDRSVMTYTFVVRDSAGVIVYTENDISVPAVPPAASTAGLGIVPTGSILPYGGENTPGAVAALALLGYLFCDGASYSNAPAPAGYEALFNVILYKYGGSSGSFQVPDYRGRMPMGAAAAGPAPIVNGAIGGEWNHVHTGPSHTHSSIAHKHGMTHNHAIANNGWTANAAVTPSPTHNGKFQVCPTSAVIAQEAQVTVPTDPFISTGVSSEVLTGDPDIPLVTLPEGTGNTGTGNPPYLTCSFIIKT